MAKLSRTELEEILDRDMPGYRLAAAHPPTDAGLARAGGEATGPSIDFLRRKYLGEGAAQDLAASDFGNEAGADVAGAATNDDEDEIVPVVPKEAADHWDQSSRPKVVVVSGKDRRVIGSQG